MQAQPCAPGIIATILLGLSLVLFLVSSVLAMAAIFNDKLQDLKTGYLGGATPRRQQLALIIGVLVGALVGALVIPPVLELLCNAYGFAGAMPRAGMDAAQALAAPQATLMTQVANGISNGGLDWTMAWPASQRCLRSSIGACCALDGEV